MTAAQTKKLKARKRGFAKPAVTPQWVVDSAARRCKQDPGPYLCGGPLVLQMKRWPSCARGTTCGRRVLDLRLWKRLWMTSSASSAEEEVVEEEYVQGPSLLGRVEAWTAVGPAVAMFLGRADPENRATVLLLLELASEFVERSRLEDVEGLMRLLEEHATAHPPWRKAARLLATCAPFW